MVASNVQLAADGPGKKMQTHDNLIGGNQVHAQGIVQVDTSGIEVIPYQTLFYDAWSASPIDTTDKWTVTGTTPGVANGVMTIVATVSTYNAIRTKDTIRANAGFTLVRNGIAIETAVATGCGRFWGMGVPATTPAANRLAQDGIGFEIDQATGDLLAVMYSAGVRTTVATLTASKPTDGAYHAYGVYFRATSATWVIDGVNVATASFPALAVVELPALLVRQNAASFTGTPVFTNTAHLTADTSRSGQVISDPIIGTRQARVNADGTLRIKDLKDTSRVQRIISTAFTTTATAETLITLSHSTDNAAVTTGTSFNITAGKRFRLQTLTLQIGPGGSAPATTTGTIRLRANNAGAAVLGSPQQLIMLNLPGGVNTAPVVFGVTPMQFPDGWEFAGGAGIGFTIALSAWASTNTPIVYINAVGYEY